MISKISLIIVNSVMLFIYVNINYADKSYLSYDGWVYTFYVFFYDLLLVIVSLFTGVMKDKLSVILFLLSFIMQNYIVTVIPSKVPFYGIYLNIFLILVTTASLYYNKNE